MNLNLGEIRMNKGAMEDNGLRSIEYELGTNEYNRLRIGIGKYEIKMTILIMF